MDIRVLQYFLAVAREESITKAAETLRMTQPPLSRQLKDVGRILRTFKIKKNVEVTDNGKDDF
ncbi:LysR family transcriptional regulator [Lachnospiraceae bacterium 29-84]